MGSRRAAEPGSEADEDAPTERFALPARPSVRPRRRLVVVAVLCGLLVTGGLVLVGLGWRGGAPQFVDAAGPATPPSPVSSAAAQATTPVAVSPAPRDPCTSAAAFRAVLEQSSPGFSARRDLTSYRLVGCSRGVALAQGSKPESDSTFVALTPQGEDRFKVESWPAGTECTAIGSRLPKTLASKFCATPEPAAPTSRATTTAGKCSPDLPACPSGYQEGVVSKANPYGCNFDAISADNPCQYRLTAEGKHNPTTPASPWGACHINGIREFC